MKFEEISNIPGYIDIYDHTGRQSYYQQGFFGQRINAVVIDSGLNPHEAFGARIITKKSFSGTVAEDCKDHGTPMTGILCGEHGMLPLSKVHHLRVSNRDGLNFLEPIHDALMWLAKTYRDPITGEPVDVVSLSISSSSNYANIREAVLECEKQNILIVCSVGNTAAHDLTFPAAFEETVAVSAVDSKLVYETYSSFGQMVMFCMHGTLIAAPSSKGPDEYERYTGTSPATPLVAGIAGLIRDKFKFLNGRRMTNAETRMMLSMLSMDLGPSGRDKWYGYGFPALDPSAPTDWTVEIPIDKGYLLDGGKYVQIEQPAEIDPDTNRTLIPVRAMAEAMDKDITWDPENRIVGLRSKRFTPANATVK